MLKNFLFTIILMVGCSLVAFGQSNDNRNQPPPKKDPPTVKVGDKNNEKKDPPKEDSNKPKKPNSGLTVNLQGNGAV